MLHIFLSPLCCYSGHGFWSQLCIQALSEPGRIWSSVSFSKVVCNIHRCEADEVINTYDGQCNHRTYLLYNVWLILEGNLFFKPALYHRHPDVMQFAKLTWFLLPWRTSNKSPSLSLCQLLVLFSLLHLNIILVEIQTKAGQNCHRNCRNYLWQSMPCATQIRVDGHNRLCLITSSWITSAWHIRLWLKSILKGINYYCAALLST